MVQLMNRMNRFDNVYFYLFALKNTATHRGSHWNDILGSSENIRYFEPEAGKLPGWLEKQIGEVEPDIVFTGINWGPVYELIVKMKNEFGFLFGKWNEPYTPAGFRKLVSPFRNYFLKNRWRKDLDFLLAIDDRAWSQYRNFVSSNSKIFLFPYYEDSPKAEGIKKASIPIIFLFSGRLAPEHNIGRLAKAITGLYKQYKGQFRFIISASGHEKKFLDQAVKECGDPGLIEYDTVFEKWEDRLRPFGNSHVLVLPSKYSGWGLVINEALNLGLPVITTKDVGAARYLVENMINGMLIDAGWKDIFSALEYFIRNPSEIERMSGNALMTDRKYSLEIGAARLKGIFEHLLDERKN
jgi:glycosyltransferase involved in cell wall biosynthesis